ncbi:MAG: AbrB family transcriptional regulator [Pseudonocardiales bacterium]|nr:MAG: AbrB family transcriptional regulator [Pseudonocardiales bacterium]
MDIAAKLTTKGQITLPKSVRDALDLHPGDHVLFRVEGGHAILARTPDFLELAGTVPVPAAKRDAAWADIRHASRRSRAKARS